MNRCQLSSPCPSYSFVVILRVDSQYGNPRADVDQQHWEGVVQVAGLFHAAVGIRWVLEVVALRVSVETHAVDKQQATDEAVQLIQLYQLQVGHLHHKQKRVLILIFISTFKHPKGAQDALQKKKKHTEIKANSHFKTLKVSVN